MKINGQYIYLSGNLRMALIYIRNCNREMEVVTMGLLRLDKIRRGRNEVKSFSDELPCRGRLALRQNCDKMNTSISLFFKVCLRYQCSLSI